MRDEGSTRMTDNSEIKITRTMLRRIEEHRLLSQINRGVICETVNMVDVVYHPFDASPALNYITPRRSAAWVSAGAASEGLARLAQLERMAHVIYLEGLMMPIFRQTLAGIGLEWSKEDALYAAEPQPDAHTGEAGDAKALTGSQAAPPAVCEDAQGLARWWSAWRTLRYDVIAPGASAALVQASAAAVKEGTHVYCLIRDSVDRPLAAGRLDLQPALKSAEIDRFEAQDGASAQALLAALQAGATGRGCHFIFAACGPADTLLAAQVSGWTLAGKSVQYRAPAAPPHRNKHEQLAQPLHSR